MNGKPEIDFGRPLQQSELNVPNVVDILIEGELDVYANSQMVRDYFICAWLVPNYHYFAGEELIWNRFLSETTPGFTTNWLQPRLKMKLLPE